MRKARFDEAMERGVFVAPWVGPHGELVLIARRRDKRLAGEPYVVPLGANHVLAADNLWERLDGDDPQPRLQII